MLKKGKTFLLLLGDILILYLSLYFSLALDAATFTPPTFLEHLLPFSLLFVIWLAFLYVFGLYDPLFLRRGIDFWVRFGEALGFCFFFGIAFFYFLPFFAITPKTNLFVCLAIFALLFFLWRQSFYKVSGLPRFLEKIIILGISKEHLEIAQKLIKNPQLGYQLVGLVKPPQTSPVSVVRSLPILDFPRDFQAFLKKKEVETVVVPKNLLQDRALANTLYQCLSLKIKVVDFPSFYERITGKIPLSEIDKVWFLEKNLFWQREKFYKIAKRAFDLLTTLFILIFSAPFWLLFAFFIKLEDGGPVFYKQERIGKDRKKFWLFKFRSMKPDAERQRALWAKKADPRVTKVGKILRTLHLDELPQMINILRGDISLVGPRPERPEFVKKLEKEIPYYHLRHLISPGFTGWAQINFRYARSIMESQEKFQYDLYYIKNRSLLLDLGILLQTFRLLFQKEQ